MSISDGMKKWSKLETRVKERFGPSAVHEAVARAQRGAPIVALENRDGRAHFARVHGGDQSRITTVADDALKDDV